MSPGSLNLTIYRGALFKERFQCVDPATGAGLNLTTSTFTAQIRTEAGATLAADVTVTAITAASGIFELSILPAVTTTLTLDAYRWGMLDGDGLLWLQGHVAVNDMIPVYND